MSEDSIKQDWAKLDLQRFQAVASVQMQILAAQDAHAQKMMDLLEQSIKIEGDKVKLKILKDKFADFKRTRHALAVKIETATTKNSRVADSARWLRKIGLGEFLPQSQTTFVWSAFYFFMDLLPEPDITIPPEAKLYHCFEHEPPVTSDLPAGITSPWGFILTLRKHNLRPRTGSAAMQYIYQIIELMVMSAATLEEKITAELQKMQEELTKLQNSSNRGEI